jgi:16S rRNA (uracil1498-N3)-methyltransferase
MADRYYINSPLLRGLVRLEGPEAHHLATVCRLQAGDQVCLFNGDGHEYPARVQRISRHIAELEVISIESPQREIGFHL